MSIHYDIDEVKQSVNCIELAERLGVKVNGDRCAATWRGGDGANVAAYKDHFYDHKSKERLSCIDLYKLITGETDLMIVIDKLGDMWGCQKKKHLDEMAAKRRMVCEYIYTDAAGEPVHKTVRYEPKSFSQARWDGAAWVPGLDGCKTYPYRLPKWKDLDAVIICEGEKDADSIVAVGAAATTLPMGAEKWDDSYAAWFAGKAVTICRDNDEPGRKHAALVSRKLLGVARSVKIINPAASRPACKDVTDWLAAGGTRDDLVKLVQDTPCEATEAAQAEAPDMTPVIAPQSEAKKANTDAFLNYEYFDTADGKSVRRPRKIADMLADSRKRFWNFPRRIGGLLFDHDRKTNRVEFISNENDLSSWVSEKSNHQARFKTGEGYTTWPQLMSSMFRNSEQYDGISHVPHWPIREDVYYTYRDMPKANSDAPYFNSLLKYFIPASAKDLLLIKAMFATPMYFSSGIPRPMFIVDSEDGRGVGKSKLAEMVARLYGSNSEPDTLAPIAINYKHLENETLSERVMKRILSKSGRQKRVVLIDNVVGHFGSPMLAYLATSGTITGLPPYGHEEETRLNDITILITFNSAKMDTDLISRAWFVNLKRGEVSETWLSEVCQYIDAHRFDILAEISLLLEAGSLFDAKARTRFAEWERAVLMPCCGSFDAYNELWKQNADRQIASDGEAENAELLETHLASRIEELGYKPDTDCLWITSAALMFWCQEAIPGFGGKYGKDVTHLLLTYIRSRQMVHIGDKFKRWPYGGRQYRGLMWNQDAFLEKQSKHDANPVMIISFNSTEKKIKVLEDRELNF